MKRFTADVSAWSERQKLAMRDIARESIQDVMDIAQTPKAKGGRMPVDTGFLRNSVASGLNGAFGAADSTMIELTIASLDIGDIAQFRWTAAYAYFQEVGTATMTGNHFLSTAAAQWPAIVAANAARVK